MKIVVLDGYTENPGDLSWAPLEALGDLTVYDRTPADLVAERIGDAEIVYTNKTPVTRETMDACPNIRFISVLATGYNIVDVAAAKEKGIPVTNIPVYGTAPVGQFAIALLLEICHHIGHHDRAVHEGRWESNPDWCFWEYPLIELAGKTMGIIGFGRIGQTTGRIAKALGMKILANDAQPSEAGKEIAEYVDLESLLAQSDVIALLLEICHHIGHHDKAVHEGRWESNPDWCFWEYPLIELAGKTMGIIGFGRIGQTTGRIAKALGMKILANDAYPSEAGKEIAAYVDLESLLAQSDVIALHCPLFPETEGIINKDTIAKMKDGVIIINNSRGPLIVEQDLADALDSGKVAAAAVDVVSTEPIKGDNPLLTAKNCIITPHISWAPKESRERIMMYAAENLQAFLDGAPVNVVNP